MRPSGRHCGQTISQQQTTDNRHKSQPISRNEKCPDRNHGYVADDQEAGGELPFSGTVNPAIFRTSFWRAEATAATTTMSASTADLTENGAQAEQHSRAVQAGGQQGSRRDGGQERDNNAYWKKDWKKHQHTIITRRNGRARGCRTGPKLRTWPPQQSRHVTARRRTLACALSIGDHLMAMIAWGVSLESGDCRSDT